MNSWKIAVLAFGTSLGRAHPTTHHARTPPCDTTGAIGTRLTLGTFSRVANFRPHSHKINEHQDASAGRPCSIQVYGISAMGGQVWRSSTPAGKGGYGVHCVLLAVDKSSFCHSLLSYQRITTPCPTLTPSPSSSLVRLLRLPPGAGQPLLNCPAGRGLSPSRADCQSSTTTPSTRTEMACPTSTWVVRSVQ